MCYNFIPWKLYAQFMQIFHLEINKKINIEQLFFKIKQDNLPCLLYNRAINDGVVHK